MASPKMALSYADFLKVFKGFLIAMAGALVTWLVDLQPQIDFGVWTPFVAGLVAVAINFLRKWITDTTAALVLVFLCFGTVASADDTYVRDNLGRKWLIDPVTADTPGAGSGFGEIVGLASADLPAPERHMVDLRLSLGAQDQASVTGLTVYYYPSDWIKLGPRMSWPLERVVGPDAVTFSLPVEFILGPDPWSRYVLRLAVNPARYTVQDGGERFEWAPGVSFIAEVPLGQYSADFELGASLPFSPGDSPGDEPTEVGALVGLTYRLR